MDALRSVRKQFLMRPQKEKGRLVYDAMRIKAHAGKKAFLAPDELSQACYCL